MSGKAICRALLVTGAMVGAGAMGVASAQTADELKNDHNTPGDVLTYGMGYGQQRYSPLTQINKQTVRQLVPVWAYSLQDDQAQQSQPIVYKGVIYISTHKATMAVEARTGRQIWKTTLEYPADVFRVTCCGNMNRGVALFDGMVYRTTLDNRVVAYSAKDGKEAWSQRLADIKVGYSMTVAPLVAEGVVMVGNSGAEYGTRGFIEGLDAKSGARLWRRYTVACPGEQGGDTWPAGEACQRGGGAAWLTGSYDPELQTVYWGTGNAGSWNPNIRRGDNLYTASVLALDPKTGNLKWHYQFTPNEGFDFDGTNEMILANIPVGGSPRKVILHADRNGFFYVLDRTNGKLLAANPFTYQTWAKGIDLATGRPVLSEVTERYNKGEAVGYFPGLNGGKGWTHMAFHPGTGLVYANTMAIGATLKPAVQEWKPGQLYFGIEFAAPPKSDQPIGALKAIDPLTGVAKWSVPTDWPRYAASLATAGGVLFTGQLNGEFEAFDVDTGTKLWSFQCGSGIEGQSVTWEADGVQYVAVTSGHGGVYTKFSRDPRMGSVSQGGTLWVFALAGKR